MRNSRGVVHALILERSSVIIVVLIVELSVENIAIIERASLTLGPGFTAFTGETGAGKSLFVDAIELAFGARADSELVRAGAPRANVAVAIDLSNQLDLAEKCRELGAAIEDSMLFLQREVFAEGRSQCRIGGKMAPLALLKQIGALLVDLHGQHDHQSLLHPELHIQLLDDWIGKPADKLKAIVAERLGAKREVSRRLDGLRKDAREREHRIDLLKFQVAELESFSPQLGEFGELANLENRLKHASKILEAIEAALASLAGDDGSAIDRLSAASALVEGAARIDPACSTQSEALKTTLYQVEEAISELRSYASSIESDPERLIEVGDRMDDYRRLFRKYGDDEAGLLRHLDEATRELDLLSTDAEGEEALEGHLSEADAALREACLELMELRRSRAIEFAGIVQLELQDLAMEKAEFEIRFETKEPEADGADRVEFLFSANAGEPVRPLAKIASGGEISRVMLAIKTAMAGKAGVPTLIFDEVDAGLGGRAAAVVAKKLEALAQHYQVVVISHLPQIAGRATTHFHIAKGESNGRITTDIRALGEAERIEEIARMLAGEQVTDSARANAREMLVGN